MKNYLSALRLPAGIFFFLLVLSSYNIAGKDLKEAIIPAFATFAIYSATVFWNNWCNRKRDAIVGNNLALENEVKFLFISKILWVIAGICTLSLVFQNDGFLKMLLGLLMFILGITYQRTEKIIGLPVFVVAISSAIPVLFPLTNGECNWRIVFIAVLNFFVMLAREIKKDFKDMRQDADPVYGKATLPLAIGEEKSLLLARICLVIAAVINTVIITDASYSSNPIFTWSQIFIICSVLNMTRSYQLNKSQQILDIGLFCILLLGLARPTI